MSQLPVRWGVLGAILAVTLVACGGTTASQRAGDALDEGLQAHIAGDLETAKARYLECLRIEATNPPCLFNSGLIAQTEGRTSDAERDYRRALDADPEFAPALYNLALLRTPADPAEAITLYRRYLEQSPGDAGARLSLGHLLRAQGDGAGAQEQFDLARQLDPSLVVPSPDPA